MNISDEAANAREAARQDSGKFGTQDKAVSQAAFPGANDNVLRATSEDELVGAIPLLLGFMPRDSVVVIAMDGKRIVAGSRFDLPDAWRLAHATADAYERNNVNDVLVVSFGDESGQATSETMYVLEGRGFNVARMIVRPNTVSDEMLEVAVEHGASLSDRATLAKGFEPAGTVGPQMSVKLRDQAISELTTENAFEKAEMWRQQAVETSDPHAFSVAAMGYLLRGDGARANLACDAALKLDPEHTLSQLLERVNAAGLPPAKVSELVDAMRDSS